jgi:uncharacterized protein YcbK (DUF882 family)
LYDILSDLTFSIGHPDGEIDIICGYRTSSTNESLRAQAPDALLHATSGSELSRVRTAF